MDSHSVEMDQDDELNQTVEDRHEFDDYDKTSETPNIDDVEIDIESNEKIFGKEDESEVSIEKVRYIFRNEFTQFSSLKRQEGIYPGKKCKKFFFFSSTHNIFQYIHGYRKLGIASITGIYPYAYSS